MAINLQELVVPIRLKDAGYKRSLESAGRATRGFSSKIGKVMGAVGLGFAAVGVAAVAGFAIAGGAALKFGVAAAKAGADAEEMLSKLQATFGSSSASLTKDLEKFAKATGRSKFTLLEMATNMGAVNKAMGFGEEEAAALARRMTELAVDVGSFNNLDSADVADRFTRALTGEVEALKAIGIVIKQVDKDTALWNTGVRVSWNEATNVQRALAMETLLIEGSIDAIGDAERTSGSWTNQQIALKAAITDTTTEIGLMQNKALLPIITRFRELAQDVLPKVVDWFGKKVVPVLEAVSTKVVAVIDAFADKGWKGAATELGFSDKQIRQIEDFGIQVGKFIEKIEDIAVAFITKGWKGVAEELGFTDDQIDDIEQFWTELGTIISNTFTLVVDLFKAHKAGGWTAVAEVLGYNDEEIDKMRKFKNDTVRILGGLFDWIRRNTPSLTMLSSPPQFPQEVLDRFPNSRQAVDARGGTRLNVPSTRTTRFFAPVVNSVKTAAEQATRSGRTDFIDYERLSRVLAHEVQLIGGQ